MHPVPSLLMLNIFDDDSNEEVLFGNFRCFLFGQENLDFFFGELFTLVLFWGFGYNSVILNCMNCTIM